MRSNEVLYKDELSLVVYLSKAESTNTEVLETLASLKKKYSKVVTFVSGNNCIKSVLTQMINDKAS